MFRIHSPERIRDELADHREAWTEQYFEDQYGIRHWSFEGSESILTEMQLRESFQLGDTIDGDQLVFYPRREFSIDRAGWLQHSRARWGADDVLLTHEEAIPKIRAFVTELETLGLLTLRDG